MPYSLEFIRDNIRKLEETFGSREGVLAHTLITLAHTGQPCDVTFFKRKPIIDVKTGPTLSSALARGAGARKVAEILNRLQFSDRTVARLTEIWTINPMPKGGFSQQELDAVDMADAEDKVGPNGETLREMIRATYHCISVDEEDLYIRRFIAS